MENYNQNPPPRNAITASTNNAEVEPASEAQNHESRVSPVTPTRDLASDLIEVFKLLADETRLRILLLLLEEGELNVRTLCDKLDQSQPGVSHHLSLLRLAGFIERRREGKRETNVDIGRYLQPKWLNQVSKKYKVPEKELMGYFEKEMLAF